MLNQIGIIETVDSTNADDFKSIIQKPKSRNFVPGLGGITDTILGAEQDKVNRDPSQIV